MHIDIRYNRGSGLGKAERVATRLGEALRRAGHQPHLCAVHSPAPNGHVPRLLVLVGGDGTVMHALGDAMALDVPVYHVPLGNENLFARAYAMDREARTLLEAIDAWRLDRIDLAGVESIGSAGLSNGAESPGAAAAGRPIAPSRFAIMLSVGPDASVIHRMQTNGRSAAGHLAYLQPISEELDAPRIVPITATVDGTTIVNGRTGLLLVANMPQYAFGVNPASDADSHDGLLDLVFIPARTVAPLFKAAAWGLIGRIQHLDDVLRARGRRIEIDAPGGAVQVDGEAIHTPMPLRVNVTPSALQVLCPVRARAHSALATKAEAARA